MYLYVNSTTQRCHKIESNFSDWKFFPCATSVNDIGSAPWAVNFFENFLKKNQNSSNGILRGLGETDSWKNLKSKILWHCPFNSTASTIEIPSTHTTKWGGIRLENHLSSSASPPLPHSAPCISWQIVTCTTRFVPNPFSFLLHILERRMPGWVNSLCLT